MEDDNEVVTLAPALESGVEPEVVKVTPPTDIFQGLYYQATPRPMYVGMSTALAGERQRINGDSFVRAKLCIGSAQLSMALGLKIAGNAALGDTASAEAKIDFLYKMSISQFDVCIVLYARHIPYAIAAQKPRFDTTVAPNNPNFAQYFGTAWVSQVTFGSEFYMIYRFRSVSNEQTQHIISELKAKGALLGGTVAFNGDFQWNMNNVMSNISATLEYRITGIVNPPFFNPRESEVWKFCQDFLKMEVDAPWIVDLGWSKYDSVPRE